MSKLNYCPDCGANPKATADEIYYVSCEWSGDAWPDDEQGEHVAD